MLVNTMVLMLYSKSGKTASRMLEKYSMVWILIPLIELEIRNVHKTGYGYSFLSRLHIHEKTKTKTKTKNKQKKQNDATLNHGDRNTCVIDMVRTRSAIFDFL